MCSINYTLPEAPDTEGATHESNVLADNPQIKKSTEVTERMKGLQRSRHEGGDYF
jgi:hypothetical protein